MNYKTVNDFVEGIKNDDYEFYDKYPDVKEVVFLGGTNVGKSSLINGLNCGKEIAYIAKRSGKT